MTGATLCSGIGAPEVAMPEIDWRWCSEIDNFPSRVLTVRHGHPNLGDITAPDFLDRAAALGPIDVLVAGTPCQAFSVAGARNSLSDDRGNLTLKFVNIVHAIKSLRYVLWENVPGVLSTRDNAFGCFLGALVGNDAAIALHGRDTWPSAGVVDGPLGSACWRVVDAQYFGLAQRRARVFLVFRPGTSGVHPAQILFEWESLRRDSAPSRTQGEGSTHALAPSLTSSGRGVERTGESRGQDPVVAFGGNNTGGGIEVATAVNAKGGSGRMDFESETFVASVVGALQHNGKAAGSATQQDAESGMLIAHSLRGEGFDASEDGTGRGTPLVVTENPLVREVGHYRCSECESVYPALGSVDPANERVQLDGFMLLNNPCPSCGGDSDGTVTYPPDSFGATVIPILEAGARTGRSTDDLRCSDGIGKDGDPMFTLQGGKQHAVAFSTPVSIGLGSDPLFSNDLAQPITRRNGDPGVVAFSCKYHGANAGEGEIAPTLRSIGHDGSHANGGGQIAVAFDTTQITSRANRSNPKEGDPCHPITSEGHAPAVAFNLRGREGGSLPEITDLASLRSASGGSSRTYAGVRRLTPRECERLMGFPDDFTLVDNAKDGPRYKALGNSIAVPVIRWILKRIVEASK